MKCKIYILLAGLIFASCKKENDWAMGGNNLKNGVYYSRSQSNVFDHDFLVKKDSAILIFQPTRGIIQQQQVDVSDLETEKRDSDFKYFTILKTNKDGDRIFVKIKTEYGIDSLYFQFLTDQTLEASVFNESSYKNEKSYPVFGDVQTTFTYFKNSSELIFLTHEKLKSSNRIFLSITPLEVENVLNHYFFVDNKYKYNVQLFSRSRDSDTIIAYNFFDNVLTHDASFEVNKLTKYSIKKSKYFLDLKALLNEKKCELKICDTVINVDNIEGKRIYPFYGTKYYGVSDGYIFKLENCCISTYTGQ